MPTTAPPDLQETIQRLKQVSLMRTMEAFQKAVANGTLKEMPAPPHFFEGSGQSAN